MNGLRRIIGNTVISLLGKAVTWTSTLLLTIAYGHYLGAFKFGELYFAINFLALIGVPLDAGFSNQIIREVAQEPAKAPHYYSSIVLLKVSIWPIVYVCALLTSWLLGYSWEARILVGICGFVQLSGTLGNTFASLHYAFERTIFPTVGSILEQGVTALLGILLLKLGAGVQAMALVMLAGSVINGIWQAAWFFRLVGARIAIDLALIRAIIRTSIPFLLYGVLLTGFTTIDTVLLSFMTNSSVVGWYGAANRLFEAMSFLPSIVISTIMYPVFSKLSLNSDVDLKMAIEKSINFLLLCSIPITVLLIAAAPNIIGFLYGRAEFTHAIPALQALAPGIVFQYINYALITALLSKKEDSKLPIMAGIALIFNLGLNLVLIPLREHIGAAITSSLTEVLLCCILIVFIPPHLRPWGSLRVGAKAFLASLGIVLAMLPLHALNLFVILSVAGLIYLGVATLLGTIPREDFQAVHSALRQQVQTVPAPVQITQDPVWSPGFNEVPETPPLLAQLNDGSAGEETETTEKRLVLPRGSKRLGINEMPETPLLATSHSGALLEEESVITVKLPDLRLRRIQQPHE